MLLVVLFLSCEVNELSTASMGDRYNHHTATKVDVYYAPGCSSLPSLLLFAEVSLLSPVGSIMTGVVAFRQLAGCWIVL